MEISSKSKHIIELSKEIIDSIELSNSDGQSLLLKATRLARYVDNDEIRTWLRYEMQGYVTNVSTSEKYMTLTGRWIDKKENKGYWIPFSQIEATIKSEEARLKQLRIPDTSSEYANLVVNNITNQMSLISGIISKLRGIKSRIISLLHDFATNVYYEKIFDNLAESILTITNLKLTFLSLKIQAT